MSPISTFRQDVHTICVQLATEGAQGFLASYIAQETGAELFGVEAELRRLAEQGELVRESILCCPECGRTHARYATDDAAPIGSQQVCGSCGTNWLPVKHDLFGSYTPTKELTKPAPPEPTVTSKPRSRPSALAGE